MYFRNFFVPNRVSVSKPQRLTYTQVFVEYPPSPGFVRSKLSYYMEVNRILKSIAQTLSELNCGSVWNSRQHLLHVSFLMVS